MTRRILILADDLTGATDSAVAFADRGSIVALGAIGLGGYAPNPPVIAFDLHTRVCTSESAMRATSQALQLICPDANHVLFKKVDSALRGNIAHELAALLAWRRANSSDGKHVVAVVAPAFPAHHRTTLEGCQLHHGQPLHASELWHGERGAPPDTIAELLAEAGLTSSCISLNRIRGEEHGLFAGMMASSSARDAVICDAETEADLRAIAKTALKLDAQPILVGSAGLARQLALVTRTTASNRTREALPIDGPILIVVGTMAAASHRQAEALALYAALAPIVVSVTELLSTDSEVVRTASDTIRKAMKLGRNILVIAGGGEQLSVAEAKRLPAEIGKLLRPFASQVGALIATGGETARAMLEGWGIRTLEMLAEVEAGIPCCLATSADRVLNVVTKSGGFGDSQTLIRAYDFLMKQKAAA